jgi:hypothetical protein
MENITREKFEAYVAVQMSGATNMFDVRTVVMLAGGVITREDCMAIMKNYGELTKLYGK